MALLAATPDPAAAEAPQIYVGSGDGYSVAFKAEGAKVSVLGLDATVYCSLTEPQELSDPVFQAFFRAPVPMRRRRAGLVATESNGSDYGSTKLFVRAEIVDEKLVGGFAYSESELSSHCQTAGYFGTLPEVPFEAVQYVPVDGSATVPPFTAAEAPGAAVYYGITGSLEAFVTVFQGAFGLRGTVTSGCHTGKGSGARGPLAASALIAKVAAAGSFRRKLHPYAPISRAGVLETTFLAGTVGDEAITGTYRDRVRVRVGHERRSVCSAGPLPFQAVRYLPAMG